jgi:hypothetical protein
MTRVLCSVNRHWAPSALGDSAFDFFWNFGTITFSR